MGSDRQTSWASEPLFIHGKDMGLNPDHLRMRGADPDDDEASLSYIRTDAYEGRKPSLLSGRISYLMANHLESRSCETF